MKFIILLGIRETDNHLLKIFFDWLSSIVANSKKFEQLLEVNNYEELKIRYNKVMKKMNVKIF